MATRIPRGEDDDATADETPEGSAPRTSGIRVTRSASATNRLRSDEPAEVPETRAAKAVRASRANARAAAAAPSAGPGRTVRIRPETGAGSPDAESQGFDETANEAGDNGADSIEPAAPAVVVLNGRRAQPSPAPASSSGRVPGVPEPGAETGTGAEPGAGPQPPATPRRRAAPRPTAPPPTASETPTAAVPPAVVPPAAVPPAGPVAPVVGPTATASGTDDQAAKAAKPKKERKPLPSVGSVLRFIGDKIGLLAQLAGLIAFLILAIHILFVASDANANNAIVSWFDRRSNGLVGDFKNIFSAKTAKGRVFYNYGLAAVVYLLAGSLVRRILRK